MPNMGKEFEQKLEAIGITTAEQLKETGSKEAFFQLKSKCSNICLVHLYALEGAVTGREYNRLPEDVKQDLKAYSDSLKGSPLD